MSTGDFPSKTESEKGDRIPLAPLPPLSSTEASSGQNQQPLLDRLLWLLLIVFAFFSASFKASNSDLFMHLASGRAFLSGDYSLGKDPFSFASSKSWVNPSWLYDVGIYLIYSNFNPEIAGKILVFGKAILAVALAMLMVRAGAVTGKAPWIPTILAFLGILACSPRFLLQPVMVSMVFLALLLVLYLMPGTGKKRLLFIPLLFLLWVNLDGWFLLGLLYLALQSMGQLIDGLISGSNQEKQNSNGPGKTIAITALSTLACFLNPHHVGVFTQAPTGLLHFGAESVLKNDLTFRGYFLSPFDPIYFTAGVGLSAAGLSYFLLLGLGVLSFLLVGVHQRRLFSTGSFLVWFAFATLSGWSVRGIPFFAIVAAPITSINFLLLSGVFGPSETETDSLEKRWAIGGRLLSLLVAGILLMFCWPGWLQSQPYYRRQVAWGTEMDQGLKNACQKIQEMKKNGQLDPGRKWLNLTPDAANYLAWFCPGERSFIDGRLHLFAESAEDYLQIRRSLAGETKPGGDREGRPDPGWRSILEKYGIDFVAFQNSDISRSNSALASLSRLYSNADEFIPVFYEGSTALFAWNAKTPAPVPAALKGMEIDFNQMAFGPNPVEAPKEVSRRQSIHPLWDALIQTESPPTSHSQSAVQQAVRFDSSSLRFQMENQRNWMAGLSSGLAGMAGAPAGPLGAGILFPLRVNLGLAGLGTQGIFDTIGGELIRSYQRMQDLGPPSSLYLAIRQCRMGLAENPDDVISQVFLAEAYNRLAFRTRERSRITLVSGGQEVPYFPHVQLIRQAQIASALQNVLKIQSRPEQQRAAHQLLIEAFSDPEYFDVRLKHLKEYLRLVKEIGPPAVVPSGQYQEFMKNLENGVKELTSQFKNRVDQFEVNSANKPLLQKARIAIDNGLAETALNLLLAADPNDLRDPRNPREIPGATMAINLLLGMGQLDQVRDALVPDASKQGDFDKRSFGMHPLGLPAYEWFQTVLGAASGNYQAADQSLADALEFQKKSPVYSAMAVQLDLLPASKLEQIASAPELAGLIIGGSLLQEATFVSGFPWVMGRHLPLRFHPPHTPKEPGASMGLTLQGAQLMWKVLEQEADLWSLRGWLALEAGQVEQAKDYCKRSLRLSEMPGNKEGERFFVPFRSRPLSALILDLVENTKGRR